MERVAGAGAAPATQDEPAAALDRQAGEVVDRWLQHLRTAVYGQRPDLCGETARDSARALVRGVVEALRRGPPGEAEPPLARAAREHARLRQAQGAPLGDVVRELQALRQELWQALRPALGRRPGDEVLALEEIVDRAIATMIERSAAIYEAEWQRARAESEAALARVRALESISEAALANLPLGRLLWALLGRIRLALGGDTARLLLVTEDGQALALRAAEGLRWEASEPRIPMGAGIAGRVAASGEPVIVDDLSTAEPVSPLLRAHIRSLVAAPLVVQGQVIGVVDAGSERPHHYTDDDLRLLEKVADRAAMAIERARLIEAEGRARAEAEAERRVSIILESMTDAFFAVDREWRLTYLNREAERFVRRKREEVLGRSLWTEFPESAGSPFCVQLHRALAEQVPVQFEAYYPPLDAWLEVHAYPCGEGLAVYYEDISQRKRLEAEREALRAEADRRAAEADGVIRSAADGVLIYDVDGRIRHVNGEAERMLGYRPTEREQLLQGWMGTRVETVDGRPFPAEEAPVVRAQRGETVRGVVAVIRRPLRAPVWVSLSAARIRTPRGEELGVVVTAADVTALHELQEETVRLLEDARRARAEAEAAQTRLEAVLQQLPSGVIIAEAPSGRLVAGNEQVARILRQPFQPMAGVEQYASDRGFHADGRPYRPEEWPLARSIRTGEVVHGEEVDVLRVDGSRATLSINSAPIRDRDGRTVAAVAIIDDISERKAAERELRESEERFRALVEATSDWVWEVDAEGRYTYASPRVRDLLGYEPDEVVGKTPFDFMPPEEAARVRAIWAGYVARQQPFSGLENTNRRKDGQLVVLESSGVPFFTEGGRLAGYRGIDRDITERRRAEEALRESEERFRRIFEEGPLGMVLVGLDFRLLRVNARFAQMLGYSAAELTARTFPEITHADDIAKDVDLARRLQAGEIATYSMEKRYITKHGGMIWARLSASMIRTPEGKPQYYLSMIEDISQRKQMEDERERLVADLRAANERLTVATTRWQEAAGEAQRHTAELDSIISSIADGVIIYDAEGHIVRQNAEAERLLAYGPAERALTIAERLPLITTAEGKPLRPEDIPDFRALRGETVRGLTMSVRRADGEATWMSASAAPIRDATGAIVGAVATATDITELHRLQEETAHLLEAERRAREQAEAAVRARDDFLAASAHELKTPLTSLRGYAQTTIRRLEREQAPDAARVRHALATIDRQSERLARLVQQLLDVASIEAGQLALHAQDTDVVALVRELVERMQAGTARHTLTLQAPAAARAVIDAERIERVVANLIDNAVKFSPEGTRVEVEVAMPEEGTVRLSVRDHGPGIPPEQRGELFSRFFQARAERPPGGLGLGLYYSHRVVKAHGGRLWAEFPEDGGSRFVLELPTGM